MSFKKIINYLLFILLLIFCGLMLNLSLPYFSSRYDVDFLLTKQKIIHLKHWRYAFYTHISLSIFSMLAGLTQFSNFILKRYRKVHRLMGYIYVVDVILLAGPSGLIMALYANGFTITKVSFVILSLLWILFTLIAFIKIKKGDIVAHKQWMIRSFSLTLSAVSLRLLALILPHFIHLEGKMEYNIISWSSWTINLLLAELIILNSERKKKLLV